MNMLCDSKVIKGLQELINKCVGKNNSSNGPCVVRKISKRKTQIGSEMMFTIQI